MNMKPRNRSPLSHFPMFISTQVLKNQTLDLPPVFVKENWRSLSKHAYLSVPTGEVWKMKLKKENGGACLDEGWMNFVENYSIKCFYVLLFKYEGGSRFSVLIFDTSTTEIEYLVSARTQVKEEQDEEDESLLPKHSTGVTRDMGRADSFESPNFKFTLTMEQTYISRGYMNVPVGPARSYFRVIGSKNIILEREDGRSWGVKYVVRPKSHLRVAFTSGWDKFANENNLSKGDRCTFELVSNTTPAIFKVTINRDSDRDNVMNNVVSHSANRSSSAPMKKFLESLGNQPFFTIRMNSSYLSRNSQLHVPLGHTRRYLKEDVNGNSAIILHGSNGKAWAVDYRHRKHRSEKVVSLCKRWKEFKSENRLREGETLVFQMIEGKPKEYNVTIFPK